MGRGSHQQHAPPAALLRDRAGAHRLVVRVLAVREADDLRHGHAALGERLFEQIGFHFFHAIDLHSRAAANQHGRFPEADDFKGGDDAVTCNRQVQSGDFVPRRIESAAEHHHGIARGQRVEFHAGVRAFKRAQQCVWQGGRADDVDEHGKSQGRECERALPLSPKQRGEQDERKPEQGDGLDERNESAAKRNHSRIPTTHVNR